MKSTPIIPKKIKHELPENAEVITIEKRRVICKECKTEFNSSESLCYNYPANMERCLCRCVSCGELNLIKKELTVFATNDSDDAEVKESKRERKSKKDHITDPEFADLVLF